jgi:gluconolactonase
MFSLPKTLEAKSFARYPDELRTGTAESGWNAGQPAGLAASSFLEGPSFDRDGTLWCVDIVNGRILTVDQSGQFSVAVEYDGWPNGLKIREDGLVFVADHKHGIMTHEPGSKVVKPYLLRAGIERFKAVNDLFFGANGDLFFTDQGLTGLHDPTGRLFRMKRDGTVDCLLSNVPSPNGLVMDLDEQALLLAVTRANAVWRVPITSAGVAKVGTFIQLSGGIGPDGLALDASGGLLIAHAGMGAVWVFNARGEPTFRVNTPGGNLSTNVAFGGTGNNDIFITESRSAQIYRATVEIPGKQMASHRAPE